jgi:hypothetical protein
MSNREYNNAIINYGNNAIKSGAVWVQGGKDNCAAGNAFEIAVKQVMNGNKFKGVSKAKNDATKNGFTYEIKSNCGSIDNIVKADFVIYAIIEKTDIIDEGFVLNYANVIPAGDFIEYLENDNLVKMNGHRRMIQNFKTSQKRRAKFEEFLWEYPSLQEYLEGLQ